MQKKNILVIGGTGYIGQTLLKKLASSPHKITALVRSRESAKRLPKGFRHCLGDLTDRQSLACVKGQDLIINLASVVRSSNKRRYKENYTGLKNLLAVMKEHNVKKIIYFSTQKVYLKGKGPYTNSKVACERLLKRSGITHLIVRPNQVYGIDTRNDFYKMAKIISIFGMVPVIGHGKNRIQPVLKDDVADAVMHSLDFKRNYIIDVSGSETVRVNSILLMLGRHLGKKPLLIHIPIALLRPFKSVVPFDVDGFTENMLARKAPAKKKRTLSDNLEKITLLLKK